MLSQVEASKPGRPSYFRELTGSTTNYVIIGVLHMVIHIVKVIQSKKKCLETLSLRLLMILPQF